MSKDGNTLYKGDQGVLFFRKEANRTSSFEIPCSIFTIYRALFGRPGLYPRGRIVNYA